jgi:hypothetical protein
MAPSIWLDNQRKLWVKPGWNDRPGFASAWRQRTSPAAIPGKRRLFVVCLFLREIRMSDILAWRVSFPPIGCLIGLLAYHDQLAEVE